MHLSGWPSRTTRRTRTQRTHSPVDPNLCFVPRVPVELWIQIVKVLKDSRLHRNELYAYDEPKDLTTRHRFITPLATANKFFNTVVTPLLYERIVFSYRISPAETLNQRSDLLWLVRELVVAEGVIWWRGEEYPDIQLFLQLRNLHTIILRDHPVTPLFAQVIRNNLNLRRLALAETVDNIDEVDASEHLHFNVASLPDSSALSEHVRLTDVTIYPGNSDTPPQLSYGIFTQFFAQSIRKLAFSTNMVQFIIPMLELGRLSLDQMVDLTIFIQPASEADAFLLPLFAILPNLEALSIHEEHHSDRWDDHPTVSDTLLPKLKKLSGIGAYITPFLQDQRAIEILEIEDDYDHDVNDIPARLTLRTLYLDKVAWKEDCIEALAKRFPILETITLHVGEDRKKQLVKAC